MKRILAFDLGANTGWACFDRQRNLVDHGVLRFPKPKHNCGDGDRFWHAQCEYDDLVHRFEPDIIVYEAIKRWASSQAALIYGGLLAQLMIAGWRNDGRPYIGYSPTEIKKFATGNGKATKEMMIDAATEILGIIPEDDNEADALLLGLMAYERHSLCTGSDQT